MFPAGLASTTGMMLLWANIHPSFPFGVLGRLGLRPGLFLRHAAIILLVPLLNPYGPALYTHLFRYLTDHGLLSHIGEFQSFDFQAEGSGQIIATVLLGMIGGTLALTQKRYHHFAIAVILTAMGLRSARALPLCALVLLPIANAAIAPYCPKSLDQYAANLRALDARCSGLWLVPLVLAACWLGMPEAGFPPDQFPVAAYEHIPPGARLFAPDKYGGYLIYRSNGQMKVFFDGRSDLFGAEFLEQYARLTQVRPGWQEIWNGYHFTHALVPNDYSLVAALEQTGWRVSYRDATATILAK
jgi:hypothetical protein